MEKISLNNLNTIGVTVSRTQTIISEGVEYVISEPLSKGYSNSYKGREELKREVAEPHLSVILLMWGDTPTVEDNPTE